MESRAKGIRGLALLVLLGVACGLGWIGLREPRPALAPDPGPRPGL